MARYSGKKGISEETRVEALRLAKGTQAPGQTKAQTKLIAQGIERGIDLYKKQQKERARALDRREREQQRLAASTRDTGSAGPAQASPEPAPAPAQKHARLPWLLLALTWAGFAVYWVLTRG